MCYINELLDDLLVNILLLIPTKEVVATSLLSRRWRSVWKLVPKLDFRDYSYRYHDTSAAPSEFIDKFLERNTSPVLETFHLNLYHCRDYSPESVEKWVNVAVARNVVDLELIYCLFGVPIRFPTSLYTHETLVVLSLRGTFVEDVSSKTCLRSLKSLSLRFMRFYSEQTVDRFLSCFPVLETLVVRGWICVNVKTYSIRVPSLQSLDIEELVGGYTDPRYDHGYVIDAPRLKFLHIVDHYCGYCSLVNVPEKLEAEIHLSILLNSELSGSRERYTAAKILEMSELTGSDRVVFLNV
ncbi:putative FBD-associated F-box protein [Raphanus sativus]|nr:putative FBD-associated F-box protein [Raphanus sativus]